MSPTASTYRPATPADWPAIRTLLEQNHLPLAGADKFLDTFVVAVAGVEIVGVAGAEVRGDVALLRSVAIAFGLHGRGLGAGLVGILMNEARRRNLREVFLLTTTAARWFPRFGFEPIPRDQAPHELLRSEEFRGAFPDSAVLMRARLVPSAPRRETLPVAVLGAGPVGLAVVAPLLERGLEPIVFEAADRVGAHLLDYGHVRLFSPWRYDIDPATAALLSPTGWQHPPDEELPLAREVVDRVLAPFAALPSVASALHFGARVIAVSREGVDKVRTAGRADAPFVVRVQEQGEERDYRARAVIDATGTWTQPNPLGANGLPGRGERQYASRILYGIPDPTGRDRSRYAGRRTLVVGAGHSVANALLGLAELAREAPGTRIAWAVRSPQLARVFGGGAADALPARGRLGTDLQELRDGGGLDFHPGVRITALQEAPDGRLIVEGLDAAGTTVHIEDVDQIVCATGQRPDLSISSELRVKLDPWLESTEALGPLIDPNMHSCGTVRPHGHLELAHPEPGFYTVGVKSYGRAPTFLMATGFEQARSVVAAIAGDLEAADRVELDLPETGVCSVGAGPSIDLPAGEAAGCCGGPPQADATACCRLDERKKSEGATGCGCGAPALATEDSAAIMASSANARGRGGASPATRNGAPSCCA